MSPKVSARNDINEAPGDFSLYNALTINMILFLEKFSNRYSPYFLTRRGVKIPVMDNTFKYVEVI